MTASYDRRTEDFGNIVFLEHVNTLIPDQSQAHLFYVTGMGFTRDPYVDFGMRNMWINLGRQQFHLPVGKPQVLRGVTGIVVPSLDELETRLGRAEQQLPDTQMAWQRDNAYLHVTTPWGNALEVQEPGGFGPMTLGMPYVRFSVPAGTADGIKRFYEQVLGAPATLVEDAPAPEVQVHIGVEQSLRFRETDGPLPDYDGHHIAIYIGDFSGPHERLLEQGLVAEESNPVQYRFNWIFDPDTGAKLFEVEHEVRSLTHPMYGRELVNRNPEQTLRNYQRGHDRFVG